MQIAWQIYPGNPENVTRHHWQDKLGKATNHPSRQENRMFIETKTDFKNPHMHMPRKASPGAAGYDVQWNGVTGEVKKFWPGQRILLPTGLYFDIPYGYEIQVRPRSGMAYNFGVTVLNSPGTIDSDYKGELKVLMINHSDRPYEFESGDRIAQIVVNKVETVGAFVASNDERNDGGFGSTGK